MPRKLANLLLTCGLLSGLAAMAFADAPAVINYQGKLADANGNPQNGNAPMLFSVYNTATGGSALFSDDRTSAGQQVPVTNGIFNVLIGTGTSLGGSAGGLRQAIQSGTALYLQVTVNSTPLTPRQRLVASPYALAVAPGSVSDAEVATGAGISVTKLSAGVFPAGNYSFTGSTVSISALNVSGDLNMNGRGITNLPSTPTNNTDAASKGYVDSQITGGGSWTSSGSNVFLNNSGNSVGIGVSNPATKLHVAGSGLFTGPLTVQGSSLTVSGGVTLASLGGGGTQMVVANDNGTLNVQAIPGGGSPVAGSGSANYVALWTGGSALGYDGSSSPFYWNATTHRLGIGTANPAYPLDVVGNVRWSGTLQGGTVPDSLIAGSGSLVSNLNADLLDGLSSAAFALANHNHDSSYVNVTGDTMMGPLTMSGSSLNFSGVTSDITSASGEHIALMPGGVGHVGVGTTSPGQMLTVAGTIESTSGGFKFPDGTTMTSAGSGSASSLSNSVDAIITGDADANGNGKVVLQTGANDRLTVVNNGNVGVGTTTPGTKLDVNGTLNATAIQQNGSALGTAAFSSASSFLNKSGDTMSGLLTLSNSGLQFSDGSSMTTAASGGLSASTNFGGDVSGTYNAIVVANDSHNHTGATISGLSASNFTSPNISQWTNNSGYLTSVSWGQVSGQPAFSANAVSGRVRMYEVGCAGSYASTCDSNTNGYVDYADSAGSATSATSAANATGGGNIIYGSWDGSRYAMYYAGSFNTRATYADSAGSAGSATYANQASSTFIVGSGATQINITGTGSNPGIQASGAFQISPPDGGAVRMIGSTGGSMDLRISGKGWQPGGGTWADNSDIRLKKNVSTLQGSLDKMLRLRGVNYEWIDPKKHGNLTGPQMGMIAQEAEKVFPQWVSTDDDGYKVLRIYGFEGLTVEAMRELKKENDALKKQNDDLEKRVKALEEAILKK